MLANLLLVFLIGSTALIDRNVVRDCAGANLDQALIAYSRIIDVMPHSVRQVAVAYLYRGRAEYFEREFEQAVGDYSKAIAIDPRLAPAFSERGSAYLFLHRFDLAISDCTQAIKINPNSAVYAGTRICAIVGLIRRLPNTRRPFACCRIFPSLTRRGRAGRC
jgi:tetratricopeptide (TPR) repeat protein